MDQPPKPPRFDSDPPEGVDDAATTVSELPADLLMMGEMGQAPAVDPATPPGGPVMSPRPAAGAPAFPPPAPIKTPVVPAPAPGSLAAAYPMRSPAAMTMPRGLEAPPPPAAPAPTPMRPRVPSIQVRPESQMGGESVDTGGDTYLNNVPQHLRGGPPAPQMMPGHGQGLPFAPTASQAFEPPRHAYPMAPPPPFTQEPQPGSGIVWAIGGIVVGLLLVALIVLALYLLLGRS